MVWGHFNADTRRSNGLKMFGEEFGYFVGVLVGYQPEVGSLSNVAIFLIPPAVVAALVARARADALAAGAGRTVDRILKIAEERAAIAASGSDASMRYAAQESVMVGGAVPVASGEIEIRMRALLTATVK